MTKLVMVKISMWLASEAFIWGASDIEKWKIPGKLEASFLIFLTLGSMKQSNTHIHAGWQTTLPLYIQHMGLF